MEIKQFYILCISAAAVIIEDVQTGKSGIRMREGGDGK